VCGRQGPLDEAGVIAVGQNNREIVEEIYAAANRGDLEAIAARMHPDVVLHQAPSLPYGGEYEGVEAAMACLVEMFTRHWEVGALTVHNIAVDGDVVITAVDLIATARPTGKQVKMPFRECFVLRDGLVVDLQPFYYDTAAIAAAFAA
jgi:ketosteroid isomerase-like protein